ncbi:hypothetical protein KUTeg_005703 [Tegillarca granosa]|uniref:PiggyBac transposable element-derived protein domain-containing protein n=1 Tax=Tegillarca granosa TaxID=220873 RepID=A0ABQ9FJN1_TEGGR|nr:hypothetical protein KUTeg_005703 [Tegillarca granosa]
MNEQYHGFASQCLNQIVLRPSSRLPVWEPITITEFKAFLAIILNMGFVKKPTIAEYWNNTQKSQVTSWFHKVMSRNRFQLIFKFLQLVDNKKLPSREIPLYRPDSKFKPLIDFVNRMFKNFYVPRKEICIDESLVASRERTSMLQYIPTKHAKFGLKFWILAECTTGYILHLSCYLGKQFQPVENVNQGEKVVFELLKECDLLNKGYHPVCDNVFCSLQIARTLRSNRMMPKSIKEAKLNPGETIYLRQGKTLICAHKNHPNGKKPVRILSTALAVKDIQGVPNIVKTYNKNMGGVDTADMLLSYYGQSRKTIKVWKKVAIHIFHRIMLNAYILYSQNTSDVPVMSRLRFCQMIFESLANEHFQNHANRRINMARNRVNMRNVVLECLPGRHEKECVVCSDRKNGNRRRARTQC